MSSEQGLSDILSALDVSNVLLYIGDAVRADYEPESIAEQGVSLRTVAASTHSSKSFASLLTGQYPPSHGVESFRDQLREQTPRLLDIKSYDTQFVNSIYKYVSQSKGGGVDPIYSVLDAEPPEKENSLSTIEPPFIYIERGPGGHSPYGHFDGNGAEYFSQLDDPSIVTDEYRQAVQEDEKLFHDRVQTIKDRGLADETLIIYTSDHGEMLGERGLVGHNGPMCPELVYVPTTLIHPTLPEITVDDCTFHHTDVAPTICDIITTGEELQLNADGTSILSGLSNEPRPCFWSNQFFGTYLSITGDLSYEGVWDSTSGYVFTEDTAMSRTSIYLGKLVKGTKRSVMRKQFISGLKSYIKGNYVYNNPQFSESKSQRILSKAKEKSGTSNNTQLTEEGRQHLRNLGYVE